MMSSLFKPALFLVLFFQLAGAQPCPAADNPGGQKKDSTRKAKKFWRPVARTAITSAQFQQLSRSHQVIAILPAEVHIAQEFPGIPKPALRSRALVEAKNFYRVLFAFLQRENSAHASPLKFQDIALTLRLLESHNLDAAAQKQLPPARLAALLGVDAILFCSINREEKLVAEANLRHNLKRISGLAGPSAGTATAHLYDGKTNEQLWVFEGLLTGNLGWNIDQTMRSVGSMVADELPYF
jgi:hypothetical protein